MKNNFCILPWIHLEVSPSGSVRPCCLYDSNKKIKDKQGNELNLKTSSIMDAWNSDDMKVLRQQFLANERPTGCNQCWIMEDSNNRSKRMTDNERFSHLLPEDNDHPKYLDIKLGNICNIKCRTCSSVNSTRWIADEIKLYGEAVNTEDSGYWVEPDNIFWDDLNNLIPTLEFLDFSGGEPFLLDKHFDFLRKCVDRGHAKNIAIHYNTNGTVDITQDMIDLWSNFKWVEIMFSIDGVGDKFEYLRHPGKWENVKRNFEIVKNVKKFHVSVCFTYSILNAFYVNEIFEWLNEYDEDIGLYMNPLLGPEYYNLQFLPKHAKKAIQTELEKFNDPRIDEIIRYMKIDGFYNALKEFKYFTKKLDKIRSEKFSDVFPELNEALIDKRIKGNKSFCMAPWTHTYISPQSERRMCCASREKPSWQKQYIDSGKATSIQYQPQTLKDHWNSDHMKLVRKKMMAGEILPECQICNNNILNLHTYKQYFTETLFPQYIDDAFEQTDDTGKTTMLPISFDYRVSNLCNFKCRMCGEQLSSSWEAEKRMMNKWSPENDPWMIPDNKAMIEKFQTEVVEQELWDAVHASSIEEIYWVGGEPLMYDIHWDIMEYLIENNESKDVTIRYNTNLSRINYKGRNLYDILPHFKKINVCASIDATGKIGEYIRTGLKWDQWLANFKDGLFLNKMYGDDAMVLDVTLTTPGLFDMKNMFDLATELDVKSYVKITFAFDPSVLMCPMALPKNILDDILDDLISYCEPRMTQKTKVYVDTFKDMKQRQTFEEQWPNKYNEGFQSGKKRLNDISDFRKDEYRMEDILTGDALGWWNG